jgi:hypothetical protein
VTIRDVSALGIGLVFPTPVEPGTLLEVDLSGATGGGVRGVLARVVHLLAEAPDTWVVGCAFVRELDADALRAFRAGRVRPRGADGRRWVRFPCDVETVCYALETAPGERVPARVLNISAGGVGLLLPCDFARGSLLRLQLPAPAGGEPRGVLLRVLRAVPHTDACWFLGCEFSDHLRPDEVEALL